MTMQLSKDPLNVIICGVGGQGNILASELLASALVEKGYFTTVGETYGASQRGGSVMSHVRISARKQYSALIPRGEAHIIIGFEPIETLRVAREYGNSQTKVIFDPRPNYPLSVLIGEAVYPEIEAIVKELRYLCGSVQVLEATRLAQEAGNAQAANILLMGALTAMPEIPLQAEDYSQVLSQRFKGDVYDLNQKVFDLGYKQIAV
ncbi:MAG TPA: indolepyruvate oxidoreductase subunit beta [Syntrophomonadaceae bacterium]|nr:indolepyruvate oxidoreductase subunit beta [Syntrophomonadaceae bacterium]HOQ09727.1 indolepyruvate oxidoreductase subunit beta [Syntrophomonadaceae bacterium]HPU48486.1 indolepyruvate oxidoreductase subunit beta [Syntrophomonadaceae bacterium]